MAKYKKGDTTFINPYNFVGLAKQNEKSLSEESTDSSEKHTGFLVCHMYVKTPLAVPDMTAVETEIIKTDDKEMNHDTYGFMKLPIGSDGEEVYSIPGSSIRGMLRSVYETITNSCFGSLKEDTTISFRTDYLHAFKPGVLKRENGKWNLYEAKRYNVKTNSIKGEGGIRYIEEKGIKMYWGDKVYFDMYSSGRQNFVSRMTNDETKKGSVSKEGYLFVGEPFQNKKYESVFELTNNNPVKSGISDKELDRILETSIRTYRKDGVNRNLAQGHTGYKGYENSKEEECIPIWYKPNKGMPFLSPAAVGRAQYNKTLNDFVGDRCKDRNKYCKACRLFGGIGTATTKGSVGRVRISDAICKNAKLDDQPTTLKELGGPHPSYLAFYSLQGKGYDDAGAQIRGRKHYWHIPKAAEDKEIYATDQKTERNASFYLMQPGSEFEFRVYYDKVDDDQLSDLIFSLMLGENNSDGVYCHHIGHGKPLGLGSVKITVDERYERGYANYNYTFTHFDEDDSKIISEKVNSMRLPDELGFILNYHTVESENVRYPFVEKGTGDVVDKIKEQEEKGRTLKENVLASHKWFSENNGHSKNGKPTLLPTIEMIGNKKDGYLLRSYVLTDVDVKKDFDDLDVSVMSKKGAESKTGTKARGKSKTKMKIGEKYKCEAIGYENGREGTPFFVYVKFKNGEEHRVPYYILKKGKDASCVKLGEEFDMKYDKLNEKGWPEWKRV